VKDFGGGLDAIMSDLTPNGSKPAYLRIFSADRNKSQPSPSSLASHAILLRARATRFSAVVDWTALSNFAGTFRDFCGINFDSKPPLFFAGI